MLGIETSPKSEPIPDSGGAPDSHGPQPCASLLMLIRGMQAPRFALGAIDLEDRGSTAELRLQEAGTGTCTRIKTLEES